MDYSWFRCPQKRRVGLARLPNSQISVFGIPKGKLGKFNPTMNHSRKAKPRGVANGQVAQLVEQALLTI